ncbi:uncharacterized protein [Clinocottus analis]|uniref:uncharacterized protein n=1 Tax=Clinocottus analis TaxID=304258 RepID=UPI0035C08D66
MSNAKLQQFRSLLTERFTTVAVEIFGEMEAVVEAFYEENKRLRDVLHMVLHPEMRLPRIDAHQHTGAASDVRERSFKVDPEISEPSPKKPKEEPFDHDISFLSEPEAEPGEGEALIGPEREEDSDPSIPYITDSFHMEGVDPNDSPRTLTADEDCCSDSDITDVPQLSRSEGRASVSRELQKHYKKSAKSLMKPKWSLQKTMLELPRMVPQQQFFPAANDCTSFLARLTEAFKGFPDDKKPLITRMGLTEDVELVDCAFGRVPKGCPLSYQGPVSSGRDYQMYDDAPSRPLLPLARHRLKPMLAVPTLSAKEQEHVDHVQITWEAARMQEQATRGRTEAADELSKLRLTGRFREICKLKPGRSNAQHLVFKLQKGSPRRRAAQGQQDTKAQALREYCKHLCVNWSPCGFVVHPGAPWLGALPDGLVYDPKEAHSFGLVHVKCIETRSFIECKFLFCRDGVLQLKRTHSHYWHIQAELLVTGTEWCDLLVTSREDLLVQRIYRDAAMIKVMKKRLDDFIFYYYLPCLAPLR